MIMIDMQDDRRIPMHPQIFGIGIDTIRHSEGGLRGSP